MTSTQGHSDTHVVTENPDNGFSATPKEYAAFRMLANNLLKRNGLHQFSVKETAVCGPLIEEKDGEYIKTFLPLLKAVNIKVKESGRSLESFSYLDGSLTAPERKSIKLVCALADASGLFIDS